MSIVPVGATLRLHYNISEHSKLIKDVSYTITEMTDETFSTPLLDENGDPVDPCITLIDGDKILAIKKGYAQLHLQLEKGYELDATINVISGSYLKSITADQKEITI